MSRGWIKTDITGSFPHQDLNLVLTCDYLTIRMCQSDLSVAVLVFKVRETCVSCF